MDCIGWKFAKLIMNKTKGIGLSILVILRRQKIRLIQELFRLWYQFQKNYILVYIWIIWIKQSILQNSIHYRYLFFLLFKKLRKDKIFSLLLHHPEKAKNT